MLRWGVVVAVGVGLAIGAGAARAESGRRLLGTVQITGDVEAALPDGPWRPLTGGAAVAGMRIRTAARGVAVVQLANGDVVGLAESSSCELGDAVPVRIRLLGGRLALRLAPLSALMVEAGAAQVRPPATSPVALGSQREALVTLDAGTVVVRPYRGSFEVAGPGDGSATQVAAGQQATLAPQAAAPIITAAAASESTVKGNAEEGGVLAALGLSPLAAGLIGGGAVVVGGAIGGAAAAGAFSSDGDDSDGGGGAQGSPFRP
jgi:hypothetical protein